VNVKLAAHKTLSLFSLILFVNSNNTVQEQREISANGIERVKHSWSRNSTPDIQVLRNVYNKHLRLFSVFRPTSSKPAATGTASKMLQLTEGCCFMYKRNKESKVA
jgi:hypothetical protein